MKKLYPRGAVVGDGAQSQQPSSSTDAADHEADMDEACHVEMLNAWFVEVYSFTTFTLGS